MPCLVLLWNVGLTPISLSVSEHPRHFDATEEYSVGRPEGWAAEFPELPPIGSNVEVRYVLASSDSRVLLSRKTINS